MVGRLAFSAVLCQLLLPGGSIAEVFIILELLDIIGPAQVLAHTKIQ